MTAPRARAVDLIRSVLSGGPIGAGDIERLAAEHSISVRTLRRAADEIGVVRLRDGGRVVWTLPPTPSDPGTPPGDTEEIDMYVVVLTPGLTWPGLDRVLAAGDVIVVPARDTPAWAATCDRSGGSFLDDLSAAAQVARWGEVYLGETGPPSDQDPIIPGAVSAATGPTGLVSGRVPLITSSCDVVGR